MSGYRPQFEAALRMFARVSEAMAAQGYARPVLVGGAAAEFYTGSAISTLDFDLCCVASDVLEAEFIKHGFIRPKALGHTALGWVHPELGMGFEIVAEVPMDGAIRREYLVLVEDFEPGTAFVIISVEDLIADRIGQYASGTAADRLNQARELFKLHPEADLVYLERRIREESMGDYGADIL
ncbi:hypothetical protein [Blastomonas sp.]|uniref:hypothetical protein n=1 Tax=Blastomonas sp. TaxID=1909299 RepID=UPI00391DFC40